MAVPTHPLMEIGCLEVNKAFIPKQTKKNTSPQIKQTQNPKTPQSKPSQSLKVQNFALLEEFRTQNQAKRQGFYRET